ncbi:uncharacterized protein LOC123508854 isoform X1 [Portunus trituberculatus]|uniref:uncharacterized protein LOC123508854 isoform X1 n=1 Tax=Portunus trituberculatus TaxID=210409 RepID=UPI001E1CE067|nr:uncharacterized protein LOC123508854 isoform X1 [Portunus trituberculatus]XP_045118757.1 uncharacterized protein LOC123508854 isoform X1 [Portunus trituberculatus]
MDMLQSANSAILYTKSSINSFSSGLDDLADSVGVGPFLALVAGAVVVAAGLGSISLSGIARMDQYFGWPLWSSIFPTWREDQDKERLKRRSEENVGPVLRSLSQATASYDTRRKRKKEKQTSLTSTWCLLLTHHDSALSRMTLQ